MLLHSNGHISFNVATKQVGEFIKVTHTSKEQSSLNDYEKYLKAWCVYFFKLENHRWAGQTPFPL